MRVVVGATLALAVVACSAAKAPEKPLLPPVSEAEQDRLSDVAAAACKCARREGADKAACWGAFNSEVERYRDSGTSASACGPVYPTFRCFNGYPPEPGMFCIVDGYHIVGDAKRLTLCTEEEAEIVSTAIMEATEESAAQGQAVGEATARRLIAGERLSQPATPKGC